MRDPKRIPAVIAELQKQWEKRPDLRLGQLIEFAVSHYNAQSGSGIDSFYIEDDKLIRTLKDLP